MSKKLDPRDLEDLNFSPASAPPKPQAPSEGKEVETSSVLRNKSFMLTDEQIAFLFKRSMDLSIQRGKKISESEVLRSMLQDLIETSK